MVVRTYTGVDAALLARGPNLKVKTAVKRYGLDRLDEVARQVVRAARIDLIARASNPPPARMVISGRAARS